MKIKNCCFHLVLGILVGVSLCLPNQVQAQGPAIITQELCWTTPTAVDSSIVGYFIFSSRDDTPLLVNYLNAQGQAVTVSGGSLKVGKCCCEVAAANPLDTIYSINNTLFVVTGGDTLSTVISNADRSTFVYKLALGEVYDLPQDTIDKYEHLVIIAASNSTLGDTAVVNFPSIPATLRYAGKRIFVYAEENVADNEYVVVVTAPQEDGGSTLGSSLRRQDCTAPNTMSYTNDTVFVKAQAVHRLLEYTTIPGKEFGFFFRECKGGGAGGSPVDTVYAANDTLYVVSGTDTLTTPILNIYTTNGTTNSTLRTVIVQSSNSELSGMIIRNAAGTIALQIIARDDAAQGYGQLRSSNGAAIAWVRSTGGRKNELSVFHSGNQTTSIQSLPDSILLSNGEVYMTKVPIDTAEYVLTRQRSGKVVERTVEGITASVENSISAQQIEINELKPDLKVYAITTDSVRIDDLSKINILDFSASPPFQLIKLYIDSNATLNKYLFHFKNTNFQVADFPGNFKNANGTEVDGGSLYPVIEDQLWDCYLDPALNDFFCNTKTFLTEEFVPFVSTWDTRLVSPTAGTDTLATDSLSVRLPLQSNGSYGFIAEWGDGSASYINDANSPEVVHTYDTAGVYTITLTGTINGWQFGNLGDRTKIVDISQWGTMKIGNGGGYFYGCANLDISAEDVLDLSGVTSIASMFRGCSVLNGPANIGDWNTSSVTNMAETFREATAFNQPIGTWNTAAVTGMSRMFLLAPAFNQPIGTWNTAAVTNMVAMFRSATAFNQPIGAWNTANVTTMSQMFFLASAFNQPIGAWNTTNVTNMSSMFLVAPAFNQPIGDWNTGAVTDMREMFQSATAFNQPIGDWNTGAVTSMSSMFRAASSFNQPLDSLNVAAVTNFTNFMELKTAANYDAGKLDSIYQFWTNQQLTPALSISFGTIEYTAAGTAGRNLLTRANATVSVTGAVANAGEIQITAVGHGMATGDKVLIYDVGGTVEADGGWIITVVDANNFTLDGSAFINTYTSGGTVRTGFGWTVTDGGITP